MHVNKRLKMSVAVATLNFARVLTEFPDIVKPNYSKFTLTKNRRGKLRVAVAVGFMENLTLLDSESSLLFFPSTILLIIFNAAMTRTVAIISTIKAIKALAVLHLLKLYRAPTVL